jgi:hypothetical protein
MGYERHDYVIAHFSDYGKNSKSFLEYIDKLKIELSSKELNEDIVRVFLGMNGRYTAIYFPDGSKKGWNSSEVHEKYREQFLEEARKTEYVEIVQVSGCLDHSGIFVEFESEGEKHEAELGDY